MHLAEPTSVAPVETETQLQVDAFSFGVCRVDVIDALRVVQFSDDGDPKEYRVDRAKLAAALRIELSPGELKGMLSPVSKLTIPTGRREAVSIPENAATYAFVYPLSDLPEELGTGDPQRNPPMFSLLSVGGFMYFGTQRKSQPLAVNALTEDVDAQLHFAKSEQLPPSLDPILGDDAFREQRLQPVTLQALRSKDIQKFAWLRPNEYSHATEPWLHDPWPNGAFVYETRDGELHYCKLELKGPTDESDRRMSSVLVCHGSEDLSSALAESEMDMLSEAQKTVREILKLEKYDVRRSRPILSKEERSATGKLLSTAEGRNLLLALGFQEVRNFDYVFLRARSSLIDLEQKNASVSIALQRRKREKKWREGASHVISHHHQRPS